MIHSRVKCAQQFAWESAYPVRADSGSKELVFTECCHIPAKLALCLTALFTATLLRLGTVVYTQVMQSHSLKTGMLHKLWGLVSECELLSYRIGRTSRIRRVLANCQWDLTKLKCAGSTLRSVRGTIQRT